MPLDAVLAHSMLPWSTKGEQGVQVKEHEDGIWDLHNACAHGLISRGTVVGLSQLRGQGHSQGRGDVEYVGHVSIYIYIYI